MSASVPSPARPRGEPSRRARALLLDWRERVLAAARRPEVIALAAITALGIALRVYFVVRWRPALVGFPDTGSYISSAIAGIFNDPLRPAGYVVVLRILHAISPSLTLVVLVQHAMGIASGLLLYGAMRRAGLVRGLGLVPAAVVMLGGAELFLEHAPLSEATFILLVDFALYAAVRAFLGGRWWAWALAAGLALGADVALRSIGLALLPPLILVFTLARYGAWRRRLLRGAILTIGALATMLAFMGWHASAWGSFDFTDLGYLDLYAHVASFADCSKFTPPAGTSDLCIDIPVSQRPGHDAWEFTTISPALHAFPVPTYGVKPPADENGKLLAFSLAAIRGQPGAYLRLVGRGLYRLIDPRSLDPDGGNDPDHLLAYYFMESPSLVAFLGSYYPGYTEHHESIGVLEEWERDTRIDGPVMAVLLLLALLAPVLARGPERAATGLFGVTALVLLVGPIAISEYDWRFVIPALGPLTATSAIGGWELWSRLRPLLTRLRARVPVPSPGRD